MNSTVGICHWCRHDLPQGALVCTKCQRHQSKTWEYGKMLLTVSAVGGLLVTATTYSGERLVHFYDSIQEAKIEMSSFSSEGDAVISNPGRRSVKVSHIVASVNQPSMTSRTLVDAQIAKYDSIVVDTRSHRTRQAINTNYSDGIRVLPNISEEMIEYSSCSEHAKLVILSKSSSEYLSMIEAVNNNGSTLNTITASCRIYYAPGAIESGQEFECVAFLGVYGSMADYVKEIENGGGKCA